ncbi:MAG: hypothetical protein HY587_02845 [Candidatus Omnitrophica bacterium]|nr:hypothetical protein [Candidatus Omnitrophota bacterium]
MNLQNFSSSLRLREYYYMVLRHKRIFFGSIAVCVVFSLVMCLFLPKTYRAETVLLVEEEQILNPLIRGLAISTRVSERLGTLREELLSWTRLTRLVEELKLDKIVKTPYEYERLIKDLREHIQIKLRGTNIITVSFEGPDPKRAQDIVHTLGEIIIEGSLTSQDTDANSAISFIEEELEMYRTNLEKSEEDLRDFKEIYNANLPIATRMNEQLVALKIELNRLLTENTEAHPRVIETRNLITHLESQRDKQIKMAQEEGVNIDATEYANLITSVPRQEQQLAKLQRDYFVNAGIYESLLQKLEAAKISHRLESSEKGTKFRILEPARLPLKPVKPNPFLMLVAGFLVGLGLGSIAVCIAELSDNSIRNVDEARFLLELPILGVIGTIRPEELLAGDRLRRMASV